MRLYLPHTHNFKQMTSADRTGRKYYEVARIRTS